MKTLTLGFHDVYCLIPFKNYALLVTNYFKIHLMFVLSYYVVISHVFFRCIYYIYLLFYSVNMT